MSWAFNSLSLIQNANFIGSLYGFFTNEFLDTEAQLYASNIVRGLFYIADEGQINNST